MTHELILQGFENLINNLSIDLRYEKGEFSGGLCQMPNKKVLIVNSQLSTEKKIKLIASELKSLDLNHIYIRPALRQLIRDEKYE